ncbi:MAG: UDP-N-acetylglucosamine 1-carboxyvinyltransferase [Clostridia bacterium]|nr:UDP-N-acetylglucosamine 1-carboxyvinyltransferase [Clostridia bacterium]
MSKLVIEGGRRLSGVIHIHGAKNSALPILAAAYLAQGPCEIENCPLLSDVQAAGKILQHLGCTVEREEHTMRVDASEASGFTVPDGLMREMRSSIVFLGAIAARTGKAELSFPGGCELGPRPIDQHLSALRQLGLQICEEGGRLECRVKGRLTGCPISLSFPSVGATENILLAAVTARGTTTIINAAREPEIVDLCDFLCACGAHIRGAGEGTIVIDGVERLHGCRHRVIPDRIETATYMGAAAITGGSLLLKQVKSEHVQAIIPVFEEAGCQVAVWGDELLISAPGRLRRVHTVRTLPYPGFPTDAQALMMAPMCVADGTSVFIETIFESRYKHVCELMRMGAQIKVEGRVAVVEGVAELFGAPVECTDLRGGAALVLAALAANGTTEITQLHHLERGYEAMAQTFCGVGAAAYLQE